MKDSITKNKIVKKAAQGAAVTGLWLLIWQAAAMAVGQELLLVSPLTMLRRLIQLVRQPVFWQAVFSSCGRIMSGVVLALAVGMILAALMSRFSFLYAFFRPALQVIKATPVASFIILALVWIKSYALGAFAAFLMVLPMVWANLYEGIAAVDRDLLEMARAYRFSFGKKCGICICQACCPILRRPAAPASALDGKRVLRQRCLDCQKTPLEKRFITPRFIWKCRTCFAGRQ